MTLTPAINLAYANSIAAKSAVGFDSLQQLRGASAPKPLGAFFTPKGFLFGGMQWEAFGLAGFHVLRSVNPLYAVTTIFDRIGCRLVHNQYVENLIMNVFTVRSSATLPELAEQARIHSAQAHQLIKTLNDLSQDREHFQEQFQQITNLSWLLQSLLEQQEMLCEQLESSVLAGGAV